MPSARPTLTRLRLFWLLMGLSTLTLFLPRNYTDWLRAPTQLLVPGQYVVWAGAAAVARVAGGAEKPVLNADQALALQNENDGLFQHVLMLNSLVQQLQQERAVLLRLHSIDSLGRYRLIPARIVAWDIMASRDLMIIDQGRAKNVARNDWITTRRFLDVGQENGVPVGDGLAVLAGEYLIGRVELVRDFTSRVRLFTDRTNPFEHVRIRFARREGDRLTFPVSESEFTLEGVAGSDEMQVTQVERKLWDNKRIRPGDLVVSSPNEPNLPGSLVIGRVLGDARNSQDNPLLCTVRVGWPFDWASVRQVYIVAPDR